MEHRDRVILQKVLSEISVAQEMTRETTLEQGFFHLRLIRLRRRYPAIIENALDGSQFLMRNA